MSLPTDINLLHFYYPIGNTPAVCLTRHLPPEADARILLLGCGDLRNTLFTCYADVSPDRALDVTFCDYEAAVIGRNILLLSLILDDDVPDTTLWSVYYHFRLRPHVLQTLHAHTQKLAALAASTADWKGGPLGALVDFPSPSTLPALRRLWTRWAAESARAKCSGQNSLDTLVKKTTGERGGLVLSALALASVLPCASPVAIKHIYDAHGKYAKLGSTSVANAKDAKRKKEQCVNPTFVAADGRSFAHYASNALIGFHLATALAPLAPGSPLGGETTLDGAARQEFSAWVAAFKRRAKRCRCVFRFAVADALSFGRVLASRGPARRRRDLLQPFVDHWHFEPLVLEPDSGVPSAFNVVDTSNLMDHLCGLNLFLAAAPLLEHSPLAAMYTELLLPVSGSGPDIVSKSLCGEMSTVAMLLGLVPTEHVTNAAVSSVAGLSLLHGMVNVQKKLLDSRVQGQVRMTWRRPRGPAGSGPPAPIRFEPEHLARILYSTYRVMFSYEDPKNLLATLSLTGRLDVLPRSRTREAWVAYVAAAKESVDTDWDSAVDTLLAHLYDDESTNMTPGSFQDLFLFMHLYGLHTSDVLGTPLSALKPSPRQGPISTLPGLVAMSPVVCITMRVPRSKLSVLADEAPLEIGTPSIQCTVEATGTIPWMGRWQNVHSVVQAGFGEISAIGPVVADGDISVVDDPAGWDGSSPMIVSFLAPTWVLLREPRSVTIKLALVASPAVAVKYIPKLGVELAIQKITLADARDLYISPSWPNVSRLPRAEGQPAVAAAAATAAAAPELSYTTTAKEGNSRARIAVLVRRVSFADGLYKDALANKTATVSMKPVSPCRVNVTIGSLDRPVAMYFPYPIETGTLRARIARTSSYIELEAHVAGTDNWIAHPTFQFPLEAFGGGGGGPPTIVPLNMPYCHLAALPVLDCSPSKGEANKWLNVHVSGMFSAAEKIEKNNRSGRGNPADPVTAAGLTPRIDIKDTVFTVFMHFAGQDGRRFRFFHLGNPNAPGPEVLVFASAIRMDLGAQSLVLDAAVVPLNMGTLKLVGSAHAEQAKTGVPMRRVVVGEDEMKLWKAALPAMAERCRTWKHKASCGYIEKGHAPVTAPGTGEFGALCGCGEGVFSADFDASGLPGLRVVKAHATRVAIPAVFSVPTVEDVSSLNI